MSLCRLVIFHGKRGRPKGTLMDLVRINLKKYNLSDDMVIDGNGETNFM